MHENEISEKIRGAAIEVHTILGPGLSESVYEEALCQKLHVRGLQFVNQQSVPIPFKGINIGIYLRLEQLRISGKEYGEVKLAGIIHDKGEITMLALSCQPTQLDCIGGIQ
ncbi:GxxExxY protein [bacterium]|nr:GxxExxY protein [bacterium]